LNTNQGILYLVATPIGNLEDITFRAIKILKSVELIAAEDTRHTLKLLNHYGIKKRLVSYHLHNERERAPELVNLLNDGLNLALVSDAGMPGISDPGTWLVKQALAAGISVVPIPGASAAITALAASGLSTASFIFKGFLPRKNAEQLQELDKLSGLPDTIIFYEAPHRLIKTLLNISKIFGNRPAVLAREMTKIHEEFVRDDINQLISQANTFCGKGEFTILVAGAANNVGSLQNSTNETETVAQLLAALPQQSESLKGELKMIAKKTGKPIKEIYRQYLQHKQSIQDN
jgi:16S rRNA (cytidine1402-2'-O)-methyltransferase